MQECLTKGKICKGKYNGKHIKTDAIADYTKANIITICIRIDVKGEL